MARKKQTCGNQPANEQQKSIHAQPAPTTQMTPNKLPLTPNKLPDEMDPTAFLGDQYDMLESEERSKTAKPWVE